MSRSYELLDVDKVTVGAVGEPGQRLFLLQARAGAQIVTLKVEKVQVAALATHLGTMLENLPRPGHLPEDLDLDHPAEPEWVVGSLGASYDEALDRLLLVVDEAVPEGEEAAEARFSLTREQVAALAVHGTRLVASGRPPCPLCGYPLDQRGHACPRTNGHRAPAL
ncbi:MAG TPA: DUF3090 family protein [Acidimicrobiales bacterium]|nr:DUF3090 family protein [Acidimicrobiales bacterium]